MSNEQSFKKVAEIIKAMNSLAGPQKAALQKLLGQQAVTQAALGIRASKDPYGKTFAPLTSRVGIPLRRTGNNIQRSWTSGQETPTTFVFGSRFKWLATHQYGAVIKPVRAQYLVFQLEGMQTRSRITKGKNAGKWGKWKEDTSTRKWVRAKSVTIPRRQMVPEMDTGGLGKKWTGAFRRVTRAYLEKLFAQKAVA